MLKKSTLLVRGYERTLPDDWLCKMRVLLAIHQKLVEISTIQNDVHGMYQEFFFYQLEIDHKISSDNYSITLLRKEHSQLINALINVVRLSSYVRPTDDYLSFLMDSEFHGKGNEYFGKLEVGAHYSGRIEIVYSSPV